jgi:hypothetical protein
LSFLVINVGGFLVMASGHAKQRSIDRTLRAKGHLRAR